MTSSELPDYDDEISEQQISVIRHLADPNGERAAKREKETPMTEEELAKLDEARAREAEAQLYEQRGAPRAASDIRAGERLCRSDVAIIAARLAREGWMPPVDPRLEAAREMMARMCEAQDSYAAAGLWRYPNADKPSTKASLAYIASCLPEGYSIADLPPVPEKDQ